MQTIGLIGGMSWHSTASYYRIINEVVADRLGGHASAPITMQSLDFAAVRECQVAGDWAGAGDLLGRAAEACVAGVASPQGWSRLGVLGARWVMEESFYADRLARHGIAALVPDAADRDLVDRVIFDELTQGRIVDASRAAYVEVIDRLAERGAQAVVLACTEIGLLVSEADSPLPLICSADAHARALAELALAPSPAPAFA